MMERPDETIDIWLPHGWGGRDAHEAERVKAWIDRLEARVKELEGVYVDYVPVEINPEKVPDGWEFWSSDVGKWLIADDHQPDASQDVTVLARKAKPAPTKVERVRALLDAHRDDGSETADLVEQIDGIYTEGES